jgi:hypothetical protein
MRRTSATGARSATSAVIQPVSTPPQRSPTSAVASDSSIASDPAVRATEVETAEPAALSDEEIAALARDRVERSPEGAVAWALAQTPAENGERLLCAVLRAWAARDPIAVVRWALARDRATAEPFMEAALTGAAGRPELVTEIGRMLLATDPEAAAAHGATLVGVLTAAGAFDVAFEFARTAPADLGGEWLAATLHRWAAQAPARAVDAWRSLEDSPARVAAWRALAAGWAEHDPAGLADFAVTALAPADRAATLQTALASWILRDPAAAAGWLDTLPRGPDFDAGAVLLLARTDQANRSTDTALRWIDAIGSPELKRDALTHVLAEWAGRDATAAKQYVQRAAWLTPEDRNRFEAQLDQNTGEAGVGEE